MSKDPRPERPSAEASRVLDPRSLRALAHPLRMRLLDLLASEGPATGTTLAGRLGENTGTVSWHLRQLAQHGYIEEDAERGTRRERWWRRVSTPEVVESADFRANPENRAVLASYLQETVRTQFRRVSDYLEQDWPEEWRGTGNLSQYDLRLTPDRLRALNAELLAVLERYRAEATDSAGTAGDAPGSLPVTVQLQSFPRKDSAPRKDTAAS
ncbi:winged helix-turn-helix domain-containing protein [Streptacidiphilus fuscans]|uniref:Helix-turn-helix transcriptional regulator n=1 Tax=Streptacidiphilus fuscans TaxID=2789292 RepID=A0A931B387_9ACTN|nr:winged helix-turn-helix domain-containing protein [Streptacidiphilus fuscans]MBF9070289.1 helix-turn-helix transcriptional regulator [Streptacidiphilus fuscans]